MNINENKEKIQQENIANDSNKKASECYLMVLCKENIEEKKC